jgi:GntR family transcriptional regulator
MCEWHEHLMPSVRDLAQALTVNPMTVSKAYNMLETEGLLARAVLEVRQLELDPAVALALFEQLLKENP